MTLIVFGLYGKNSLLELMEEVCGSGRCSLLLFKVRHDLYTGSSCVVAIVCSAFCTLHIVTCLAIVLGNGGRVGHLLDILSILLLVLLLLVLGCEHVHTRSRHEYWT